MHTYRVEYIRTDPDGEVWSESMIVGAESAQEAKAASARVIRMMEGGEIAVTKVRTLKELKKGEDNGKGKEEKVSDPEGADTDAQDGGDGARGRA
jgi:hypothetical protein